MPTREVSTANREQHHLDRIRAQVTARGRFWRVCAWVIAEAVRDDDVDRVSQHLLGLVELLRTGKPLPRELHKTGATLARAAHLNTFLADTEGKEAA